MPRFDTLSNLSPCNPNATRKRFQFTPRVIFRAVYTQLCAVGKEVHPQRDTFNIIFTLK